ncbi:MAG: hypothetical protein EOL87_08205 [Spartobacteria bacterium]|nr:hypothetical protein [Spartobacteria bacterium]
MQGTIGEILKQVREQKGLTERDVIDGTHMLMKHVVAIENDDFSRMAAPMYAKGFIKLYAEFIGLDAKPFLTEFDRVYGSKRKPAMVQTEKKKIARAAIAKNVTPEPEPARVQPRETPTYENVKKAAPPKVFSRQREAVNPQEQSVAPAPVSAPAPKAPKKPRKPIKLPKIPWGAIIQGMKKGVAAVPWGLLIKSFAAITVVVICIMLLSNAFSWVKQSEFAKRTGLSGTVHETIIVAPPKEPYVPIDS